MTTQQESIRLVRDKVQYILGLSACEDNRDFPTIYNACYDILSVLDSVQPTPMPEAIAKAREALLSAHQEIESTGIAEGVHFGDDPLVSEKIVNALAALDYVITTNAQTVCQQPIVAMQQGGSITGGSMLEVKEPEPVGFTLTEEFNADQWWVIELEQAVEHGTCDQKRAVAVVHNLLRQIKPISVVDKSRHVICLCPDCIAPPSEVK
jgi:hypothetical protein